MFEETVTDRKTLERLKQYPHMAKDYFYGTRNDEIFPWCLAHNVPLICFGDQPDLEGSEKHPELLGKPFRQSVLFEDPLAVLYEAGG
jgi:hypothetical protein